MVETLQKPESSISTSCLLDEIDKMSPTDQTLLLNLMETGIVAETKIGKTREIETKTSIFATCNAPRKLSAPLQSRFFIVEIEPYIYEQFYDLQSIR